ncbi:MAG TPA: sigma-70 family RNA polymerase sigma factor [Acidimicrobiales bacterium]|nr:sigma-70 family RNA polymerase sigma factor [Acidimicrobiales bacterium]
MAVPAREMEDDSVLVHAVQAGDLEAFSELFRRHYPGVKRSCARRMACPLEAEEIAQAAFVRALERISQCSGERHFGGWVQIIARHMCVDALRTRSRVVPSASPLSEDHVDGHEPHDSLLDRERRDDVRRALETLPLRQRLAVTARAEGSGPGEIADDLGVSVGAVDSLILRGRRRLALAYRRVAGEGGATATATSATAATAAASLLAVVSVGSTRLLGGVAAAAEAGRDLVRPVVSGVASAIMAVAVAFTGGGPAGDPQPATAPATPPTAVVVRVPFPDPRSTFPGAPTAAVDSGPSADGSAPVGQPFGPSADPAGGPGAASTAGVLPGSLAGAAAALASGTTGSTATPADGPASKQVPAALPAIPTAPVVDPALDAVDGTTPVTPAVDDPTAVVDEVGNVADDALGAVGGLLPK